MTVLGSAADWTLEAMFAASPKTSASLPPPLPITTLPVAGIDSDADRELGMFAWSGAAIERADRLEYSESRARGALGVVVVRLWPSEIRHHAVAEILRDVAAKTLDRFSHCAEIFGFDLTPFLRIEPCGNRGRADQVAKQDRQVTALAYLRSRFGELCVRDSGDDRRTN